MVIVALAGTIGDMRTTRVGDDGVGELENLLLTVDRIQLTYSTYDVVEFFLNVFFISFCCLSHSLFLFFFRAQAFHVFL